MRSSKPSNPRAGRDSRSVAAPAWQEAERRRRRTDAERICAASSRPSATARRGKTAGSRASTRVLLHPVGGLVVLAAVLFVMFQAVFSWAEAPMDWIDGGMAQLGAWTAAHLPGRTAVEPARQRRDRAARAACSSSCRRSSSCSCSSSRSRTRATCRAPPIYSTADGRCRALGPRVHPAAVEFRLRDPRHHGGAHHPELARPPDHHHDRAAHDLLGAPAGVRAAHRRAHSRDGPSARSTCRAW